MNWSTALRPPRLSPFTTCRSVPSKQGRLAPRRPRSGHDAPTAVSASPHRGLAVWLTLLHTGPGCAHCVRFIENHYGSRNRCSPPKADAGRSGSLTSSCRQPRRSPEPSAGRCQMPLCDGHAGSSLETLQFYLVPRSARKILAGSAFGSTAVRIPRAAPGAAGVSQQIRTAERSRQLGNDTVPRTPHSAPGTSSQAITFSSAKPLTLEIPK